MAFWRSLLAWESATSVSYTHLKQLDKGRQVYAFGAGTQKMYDYLNDNPECMSAPVDYTNDCLLYTSRCV